jgi:hypothetical protein
VTDTEGVFNRALQRAPDEEWIGELEGEFEELCDKLVLREVYGLDASVGDVIDEYLKI